MWTRGQTPGPVCNGRCGQGVRPRDVSATGVVDKGSDPGTCLQREMWTRGQTPGPVCNGRCGQGVRPQDLSARAGCGKGARHRVAAREDMPEGLTPARAPSSGPAGA